MKSKAILSFVIFVLICSFSYVFAGVPQMINYQGKLTTHQEVLVDDTVSIIFTIYDDSTGGTALWTENQSSVVVKEGVFSVLLGSMDPIPDTIFTGEVRYLGVKVGEDSEMIPRRTIVSAGYAYRALVADSALTAPPSAVDDARYLNTDVPDSIVLATDSSDQYLFTIRNQWTGSGLLVTTTHGATIKAVNDAGIAIYASSKADAIVGVNLYEIASGQHCGVRGEALNTVPNMWGGIFRGWGGVYGQGTKYGVHGYSTDSTGVYGYSDYLCGVKGFGNSGDGVWAISIWGEGVNSRSRYGDAFHVDSTGGAGLWVDSAGTDGIHINKAVGWAGYFNGKSYFSDSVGIGTTNPQGKLDINGSLAVAGDVGDSGQVLTSQGAGANPVWSEVTAVPADYSVSQVKLKTATGEVSAAGNTGGSPFSITTLPGGTYGFYPQTKVTGGADMHIFQAQIAGYYNYSATPWGNYVTSITLTCNTPGYTIYAQQRYVTASGKDHWMFFLFDKETRHVIAGYQAPDHPCHGSGGDENDIPHPFGSYDPEKHKVILIDNEILPELKSKVTSKRSLLTIINEDYEIDFDSEPAYQPREIIEIDEYGDKRGEILQKIKTPEWAKILIGKDEIYLKRRLVETLPDYISYKKLRPKSEAIAEAPVLSQHTESQPDTR